MKNIIAAFLFVWCSSAMAGDVWLDLNLTSLHTKPEQGLNRQNYGAGIEYRTGDILYMIGAYRNSYEATSAYVLAGWTPLSLGSFRAGALIGAINGYPALNNGGVTKAFAGIIQIEGKNVGMNIVLIPPAIKDSPVTLGFQIKFRYR